MILREISISTYSSIAYPYIGVLASVEWLSIYDGLTCVGIFNNEHLIGGFYYLKVKKFGFDFIKLPPYSPYCGLFFINESKNKSAKNDFTKEIMTEVSHYISRQRATLCILAFPSEIIDMQPLIWDKFKVVPSYTYRIDLTKSIDIIKSNFDSKNRNKINKALKENLVIEENGLEQKNQYDFFRSFLSSTGANVYENVLKNINTKFPNENNSFCFSAKKNNELLGAVFCIYDKNTCYYILAAVNKNSGVQGVNNLLVQKCIEKSKDLGCTTFDFEGSMLKGVEKFFRSFGPELFPYFTVNKAILPLEMLLKFKKRELF